MFLSHLLTIKILSLAPVSIFTCAGCQPLLVTLLKKREREREGGGILFSDTVSFQDCFDGGRMTYEYSALRV